MSIVMNVHEGIQFILHIHLILKQDRDFIVFKSSYKRTENRFMISCMK